MSRLFGLLLCGIIFLLPALAQKSKIEKFIPKQPIGWVSDFENNFTEVQINFLDSVIAQHETETGDEIAIVTLQLDSVAIKSTEEFEALSLELFNQWGVGKNEKNNGVGIVFSKKLRKIRIEVGKGLESKLTDKEAKDIIDDIILPEFKKSNYYEGILKGLQEIIKEIR